MVEFFERVIKPNEHYVPILLNNSYDALDLIKTMPESDMQRIANNAQQFAQVKLSARGGRWLVARGLAVRTLCAHACTFTRVLARQLNPIPNSCHGRAHARRCPICTPPTSCAPLAVQRYLCDDAKRFYFQRAIEEYNSLFADMEGYITDVVLPLMSVKEHLGLGHHYQNLPKPDKFEP